jgi:hypothetical protein
MYVIYENGRSKIYRFPRTTNSLQVIGVKNDGPIANNYVCQTLWKPDSDSPLKFGAFKVSLPAALPTLSLGVDPKTHTYFLQAVFQSTEMAKWAYMRLVQKTCFIELDTGESIDFIYNLMNPPTSTTVRIPLDLLKYMRDNPSVSLSNVTINLISWDLYLPFVVSVDGSLDARPLALGDMTFDFNGTWPLMPSFSSGVIHVEKDYITDGLFAINCTGLMDNVKEIQFTWGVDNSNWIDENAQAVSSPYTYTFDTPSEFFNSPVPSHFLVAAAADENQFMVRLPYASPNKKSVTDGSAAGMTHYGTMVTFVTSFHLLLYTININLCWVISIPTI